MYNDNELEPRINSIVQLSEAQQMIREVTVTLPISSLTDDMVTDFTTVIASSQGNILLRVKVFDPESGVALSMFSKKMRIDMTRELVGLMDDRDIKYTIN